MARERHFHQQLDDLKLEVLQMAAMVEGNLAKAVRALLDRDAGAAEQVIEADKNVNLKECRINEATLKLLALDQPMAKDLRFLVGTLRVVSQLERIGDQAVGISRRTIILSGRPALPFNPLLEQLAEVSREMVASAVKAYADQNPDLASGVCEMDNQADDLNDKIIRNLIEYMINESPVVERGVRTIFIASSLERVADLATNIAEAVIFIVEGVDVKLDCCDK